MKQIISIILSMIMLFSATVVFAEEKLSDGNPPPIYTFEELTGLSREDIDHIVIRSGVDGVGYSTAYDKVISDIYNTINTKSFNVDIGVGNSGGWKYQILFFGKSNSACSYTISTGIVIKEKDGLTYRTSNEEELTNVVENAYTLIANDCSNWAADYVAEAKDLGFLEGLSSISYKESITREEFCELIFNYINNFSEPAISIGVIKAPFNDTDSVQAAVLSALGIIKGKSETKFAPNDYLTREEAATIIYRLIDIIYPDWAATELYFEFADSSQISDWAMNNVQVICNMGIMEGIEDNKFAPKDTYTTEQAIATLVRVFESAEFAVSINKDASIGIIGGADGPTSIIVGEYHLKFSDKDGNIILSDADITNCEAQYVNGMWALGLTISDAGKEKFREATGRVSGYPSGENYIAIVFEEQIISAPTVVEEIESNTVMITGSFTEESAKSLAETINMAIK